MCSRRSLCEFNSCSFFAEICESPLLCSFLDQAKPWPVADFSVRSKGYSGIDLVWRSPNLYRNALLGKGLASHNTWTSANQKYVDDVHIRFNTSRLTDPSNWQSRIQLLPPKLASLQTPLPTRK